MASSRKNQNSVGWLCLLATGASLLVAGPSFAAALTADIVVTGGSLGAPAAALAAARSNPSAQVLLVEPMDWLGGQATVEGVSAIDNCWHAPAASLMANNRSTYYPADWLTFLDTMKTAQPGMPGTGMGPNGTDWVTREAIDPRSAAWVLDQMMAAQPNLGVLKMCVVKNVATTPVTDAYGSGAIITGLSLIQRSAVGGYAPFSSLLSSEMPDWYSSTNSTSFTKTLHTVTAANPIKGLVVIDGSETGDAIVLSGAKYTVGREQSTEAMGEDGSIPAHNETQSQAIVFPFCMTSSGVADPETGLQSRWANFNSYYNTQVASLFSFSSYSWAQVWTYRRLLNTGVMGNNTTANAGDVSMQNWSPGNDFPYGSIYLDKATCSAQSSDWLGGLNLTQLAQAEEHSAAWYYYMKNNRTAFTDTHFLSGADTLNMMGTSHGLAKFPYIRCGRRIIGLDNYRVLSRYFVASGVAGTPTSYRYFDAVGIGDYACDIHAIKSSTGVSPTVSTPAPFYIPYRALGSANVRNLLAGDKNFAATYSSNAAYRLHPIEWAIGSAAGCAAAVMTSESKTNIELLDTSYVRELQNVVKANSPIHWAAYDAAAIPPQNGDLILNNQSQIYMNLAFRAEVYHHRGVLAKLYRNGTYIGQTTTKANGRLVMDNVTATSAGITTFTAECYDGSNVLLDTLTAVANVSAISLIVDDADGSPAYTSTGTWGNGANGGFYGSGYKTGNASGSLVSYTRSATWRSPITQPGTYTVATWYVSNPNRCTDSPFIVTYNGGSQQATVRINQQNAGSQWVPLGSYYFQGNSASEGVQLTNASVTTANFVIADAVSFTPSAVAPVSVSAFRLD